MLAAGIFTASAATATLSLGENQTVKRGETVTVELSLLTDFNSDAFQFDIILPEGLAFDNIGNAISITRGVGAPSDGISISNQLRNGDLGARVIAVLNQNGFVIPCRESASVLFSFNVLTANAEPGVYTINLTSAVVTNCDEVNHKVSVRNATLVPVTITIEEAYSVTWKDHEGNIVESDLAVLPDAHPAFNGDLANTVEQDGYTYTFKGWKEEGTDDSELVNLETYTVNADVVFVPVYLNEKNWAVNVENTEAAKAEKLFRDGKIVIRKNGAEFNALGQKL